MKLYTSLREQVNKTHLTKKEIDTLLWLLRSQDDFGTVLLVHWKELTTKAKMVAQSFYNAVNGLEAKGIITKNIGGAEQEGVELEGVHRDQDDEEQNQNFAEGFRGFHSIQILTPTVSVGVSVSGDTQCQHNPTYVSVETLKSHIVSNGTYLNLRDCGIVYTDTFRRLQAEAKKIILHLLYVRQSCLGVLGKRRYGKAIIPNDMVLTLRNAAELLGIPWKTGKKGEVARRKVKRYFTSIASCDLLCVRLCEASKLHFSLEDMKKDLTYKGDDISAIQENGDSLTDITNRRIIDIVLNRKAIKASPLDYSQ